MEWLTGYGVPISLALRDKGLLFHVLQVGGGGEMVLSSGLEFVEAEEGAGEADWLAKTVPLF